MKLDFIKEKLNLSVNSLKEVAKLNKVNFDSLSTNIANIDNELSAIDCANSMLEEVDKFLVSSYDSLENNQSINENVIKVKQIKTELTNLISLLEVESKKYTFNGWGIYENFKVFRNIYSLGNKILGFIASDTGLQLKNIIGDDFFRELIFPNYMSDSTSLNDIIADLKERIDDIYLKLQKAIKYDISNDELLNLLDDKTLVTCRYLDNYEYLVPTLDSCTIYKDYIVLDKDFYNTGGGIDLGHYTILKEDTLFILTYDGFSYGSYSIPFNKALALRNTNRILWGIGYDGYISFDLLLHDSDISEEHFDFINGECDIHFDCKKECFEYFESMISNTIYSLNQ